MDEVVCVPSIRSCSENHRELSQILDFLKVTETISIVLDNFFLKKKHYNIKINVNLFFFLINMVVRVSLRISRLILRTIKLMII
jgi:hypothetical protein